MIPLLVLEPLPSISVLGHLALPALILKLVSSLRLVFILWCLCSASIIRLILVCVFQQPHKKQYCDNCVSSASEAIQSVKTCILVWM